MEREVLERAYEIIANPSMGKRIIQIDVVNKRIIYNNIAIYSLVDADIFSNDGIISGELDDSNNLICTTHNKTQKMENLGAAYKTKYWVPILLTLGVYPVSYVPLSMDLIFSYAIGPYSGKMQLNNAVNYEFKNFNENNVAIIDPYYKSIMYDTRFGGMISGMDNKSNNKFTDKNKFEEAINTIIEIGHITHYFHNVPFQNKSTTKNTKSTTKSKKQ